MLPGQSKRNTGLSLAGFLWLLSSACLFGQSTIQFSPRCVPSALEDAASVSVSVTRVDALETVVTVDYATADVTATAGQDYLGASGTLTFAVGETNQTFSVPILNDALTEGNEAFEVTLRNPGPGAVCWTADNTQEESGWVQPRRVFGPRMPRMGADRR